MVTIYILKCKEDKYYVGKIADNVYKRIKQHFGGKGAKWTQRYQPKVDEDAECFARLGRLHVKLIGNNYFDNYCSPLIINTYTLNNGY